MERRMKPTTMSVADGEKQIGARTDFDAQARV